MHACGGRASWRSGHAPCPGSAPDVSMHSVQLTRATRHVLQLRMHEQISTCGLQVGQLAGQRNAVGGDAHVRDARHPRQLAGELRDVGAQRGLPARQPDLADPRPREQPGLQGVEQMRPSVSVQSGLDVEDSPVPGKWWGIQHHHNTSAFISDLEGGCNTAPTPHSEQGFVPVSSAHQAQDLAGGEELPGGRQIHPLRRHAVQAAQVAALRQRDAQVAVPPPANGSSLRGQLSSFARRAPQT